MAMMLNLKRDEKKKPAPFVPLEFMSFMNMPEEEAPIEAPEVLSEKIGGMFGF